MTVDELDGELLSGRVVPDHHDGGQLRSGLGDLAQHLSWRGRVERVEVADRMGDPARVAHHPLGRLCRPGGARRQTRPGRAHPVEAGELAPLGVRRQAGTHRVRVALPRGASHRSRSAPPGGGSCRVLAWRSNQRWRSFCLGSTGHPSSVPQHHPLPDGPPRPPREAAGVLSPDGPARSGSRAARARVAGAEEPELEEPEPPHVRTRSPG